METATQQIQVQRAVQQALALPKTHFKKGAYITLPTHRRDVRILLVAFSPLTRVGS
ncbi:MAG TPA: hypothetical protein VFL45_02125 [Gammaproteobacteria bacterium]|nr:hypothetical protein [Gammaproteobacteria bacterium]